MTPQPAAPWLHGIALACLFASTTTPLLFSPELAFPFVTGKVIWLRLCTLGAGIALVLALLAGWRTSMPWRLVAAMGAVVAVSFAADLQAQVPSRAIFGTVDRHDGWIGLLYGMAYVLVCVATLEGRMLRAFVIASAAVSLPVCAVGLYSAWLWWPHKVAGGTFGNPSYMAVWCAIMAMLCIWLALHDGKPAWFLLAKLNIFTAIATQSRAILIAFALAAAVIWWPFLSRSLRLGVLAVASFCLTLLALTSLDNERMVPWQLAWQAVSERPWLGVGHEHFAGVWEAYQKATGARLIPNTDTWDRAHNWVLDRLLDAGVAGLAAWLWLVAEVWRQMRAAPRPERQALYGAGVVYLVTGMFLFDLHTTTALLAVVVAVAVRGGSVSRDVHRNAVFVLDRQPLLDGR